jgi:hypothetical protein
LCENATGILQLGAGTGVVTFSAFLPAAMRLRLLTAVFLQIATACVAEAHPLLQNAMWVVVGTDRVRVALNVSLREIAVAQLPGPGSGDEASEEIEAATQREGGYLLSHLTLSSGGRTLAGAVVKVTPPAFIAGSPEETVYQYELEYPLSGGPPAQLTFRQDMLREFIYSPGQPWDVSYLVRLKRSDGADITTALLRANAATLIATGFGATAESVRSDAWRTAREYTGHGIMHILTGYDHLLFVGALVIATMSIWEMVKVIAAFTLAHTLTLVLSVLNIFRLPPWVVEPVIAASIVFVAVENILSPGRTHGWLRLGVAFGFGLVHGLGFAGGLLEAMAGLRRSGLAVALLSFGLGVEIGHQVVVLPLFGVLRLGQLKWQEAFRGPVLRYGSIVISMAGVYYFINAIAAG